jgi:hypothetical protein
VLSADVARGFSGEGESLSSLADVAACEQASALKEQLSWSALPDLAGTAAAQVRAALTAAQGDEAPGAESRGAESRSWAAPEVAAVLAARG